MMRGVDEGRQLGGAVLSDDGVYRYRLTREWGIGGRTVTFVMLNPSIADAAIDDMTIRRCIGFAKACQGSRLVVVNLYALVSTDPAALWGHCDPVGPSNDAYLAAALVDAAVFDELVVVAWGNDARPERVEQFMAIPGAERATALGQTKRGAPRHPSRLAAAARPRPWPSQPAGLDGYREGVSGSWATSPGEG